MAEKTKKVTVPDEDDFMKEMRERFREGESGMEHIVEAALDDITMVDGENQWDNDVKKFRTDHGLVIVTENLLPSFIDQVEGDFRQNKPQVNCVAVDGEADPETARILAGMIRNIHYQSQAESIHDEAFLAMLASSYGSWRVHTQYEDPMSFNKEIVIQPIENHLAVRWDMTCKKFDTSDKKWTIISEVISKKEYEKLYGEEHPISSQAPKGDEFAGWYLEHGVRRAEYWYVKEEDTPIVLLENGMVVLKSEASGIIAKIKRQLGFAPRVTDERTTQIPTVYSCIVSGEGILEGPFEWPGKYIPIPICFGKRINLNGKLKLKSLIRDAKESQRMHNYLISSMVQGVAMQQQAPYVGTTTQFEGKKQEWQAGLDGNVPFLTYNPDPTAPGAPQRQSPPMSSQGHADLLQINAKTRMDIIGIHEAGLGARSNEQSGVAIQARQKEGDVGTFVFIDNFRKALQFEGKIQVDLIPKIYDTPRMQRILGIDGKDEFVQLYENATGPNGPYLKANPKVGKYDVVVTTGPNFTTQREQTRDSMVQTIQALGPQNPASNVLLPSIVKTLDWDNADKIAEALTSMLPPQIQQILTDKGTGGEQDPRAVAMQQAMTQQVQQMQQQMQQAMGQAQQQISQLTEENQQLKSGLQAKLADIEAKKEMHALDKQLERERLMNEQTIKEKELAQKHAAVIEELKAKMASEITLFMQKVAVEKEIAQSGAGTPVKESVSA